MKGAESFEIERVWIIVIGMSARLRMSIAISRQQLAVLVADVARRDALIASWMPATGEFGGDTFYHEANVRTLYPGCTIAYTGLRRVVARERPTSLYDWVVSKDGVRIATHRAMAVMSSTGEPVAVVGARPHHEPTPTYDQLPTPEPSPELLAALEADPIEARLDAAGL
jgi:hypothetical protein